MPLGGIGLRITDEGIAGTGSLWFRPTRHGFTIASANVAERFFVIGAPKTLWFM